MKNYARHFSTVQTPQSQPIPGQTMVANEAGGFAFPVDDWTRLDRFLLIGTTSGTYYVDERKLTVQNADAVLRCIQVDGVRVVNRIVEISDGGRAPKNDPAIFALALAAKKGNDETRKAALQALPKVCRIGTHLFGFVEAMQAFGGWGQGTMRAFARWYNEKAPNDLAYELVKYRQREGISHDDVLRLAHVVPVDGMHDVLYRWVAKPEKAPALERSRKLYRNFEESTLPRIIEGYEKVQAETGEGMSKRVAALIREYGLPREVVPTGALNSIEVWEALLEKMPLTAMIRNLGKMSQVGLLKPLSDAVSTVTSKLGDPAYLRKSRIHPFSVLVALKTYGSGHGLRGSLSWTPVPQILDVLDGAFYAAFGNVKPSGKRIVLGIDCSGSMDSPVMGIPNFTVREAAAALAHIALKTDPQVAVVGFTVRMFGLDISRNQRADDVLHAIDRVATGEGTDCAIPMLWAMENDVKADAFVLYTDGETWAGNVHPIQAVWQYRKQTGTRAKFVASAMTASGTSIAPFDDAGCLNVVGFDAGTPTLISDFLAA